MRPTEPTPNAHRTRSSKGSRVATGAPALQRDADLSTAQPMTTARSLAVVSDRARGETPC